MSSLISTQYFLRKGCAFLPHIYRYEVGDVDVQHTRDINLQLADQDEGRDTKLPAIYQ